MIKLFPCFAFLIAMISCNSGEPTGDIITLDTKWKFKTGDNPQWAQPGFNDAGWATISNRNTWESQGFSGYDGYAWYRLVILIPSRLRKNSYFKDSLQFLIGKIDDTDQTFLNGEPLGSNNLTVTKAEEEFGNDFEDNPDAYSYFRRYVLPADDPRIKWDQPNVIVIRVHDHGGGGGLYSPDPSISMVDLKDFVKIDMLRSPFKISENHFSKEISLISSLENDELEGELSIQVKNPENGEILYENVEGILLSPESAFDYVFNFDAARDHSYRVNYSFLVEGAKNPISTSQLAPYILTPPAPLMPRINTPDVYGAGRGKPFLYYIPASGRRPMNIYAENLPAGLSLDSETGIITGRVYSAGDYKVLLVAQNNDGRDEKEIIFKIGDQLALTPPLGWNSWNAWGLSVDDEKVRNAAKMMKESGLINYGWSYINIDDGWEASKRTSRGELLSNDKFPDMRVLSEYIHELGLKIGIYSSPGPLTCGGFLGSYQHEYQDARTWAYWGIDYLKYDWCSYREIAEDNSMDELQKPYILMNQALKSVNRDIVYSLCQYGMGEVWEWGKEVGGNLWRTTGDIKDTWESMSTLGFNANRYADFAEPGHWNDVDMLVVGWVGWGPNLHPTRLTPDEQYSHISLWALLSSPMLLGCDLNRLDDFTLNLLTNHEVLAIHQDSAGNSAEKFYDNNGLQIWIKRLGDGSSAIGFFNLSDSRIKKDINFSDFGFEGTYAVRDLWRQVDLGELEESIPVNLPSHGVYFTRFRK